MARIRLFLLFFLIQLHTAAAPAYAQDDVSAQPCQLRVIRALMTDETVANMVRCQYDEVRSLLPGFTTIDWLANDRVPLGMVMRQSAPQGTPFAQLEAGFNLVVSAGPTLSINSPSVLEGGILSFQLRPPPHIASPYAAEYRLALDPQGRREARAGTHYASVDDSAFLRSGRIEVSTIPGSEIEQLYLLVMLVHSADGAAGMTTIGRGAGTILPYPQVLLEDAAAEEGKPLRFVARIERSGLANETLTYRYAFGGDALEGVDYVGSPRGMVTFAPGRDAMDLVIRTLDNPESIDDHRLLLSIAAPGHERSVATGTIVNTTGALEQPIEPVGEGGLPGPDGAEGTGLDGTAIGNGNGQEREDLWSMISDLGLEWLAVIGAVAIGVLGGLIFGRRKNAATAAEVDEPYPGPAPKPEPAAPPIAPVVGWTTTTPRPPRVKSGAIPIDGPAITIDSGLEPGVTARLESLPILPEELSR